MRERVTRTLYALVERLWQLGANPRVQAVVLCAALAGYAVVSLAPFEWGPPRQVENGAAWTDERNLAFPSAGLVIGRTSPAWLATVKRDHELEIDLRFRPADVAQSAHILTIGAPGHRESLRIAQKRRHLLVYLTRTFRPVAWLELPRTAGKTMRNVLEPERWHDVTLVVRPGRMEYLIDGSPVGTRSLPDAPLAVWDDDLRVALGNALDGDRPWRGVIGRAVVRTGGTETDLLDPSLYLTPKTFWLFNQSPSIVPFQGAPPRDVLHNLVMYVPFGALLALLAARTGWAGVVRALLVTALVSVTMETTQFFFSERQPSTTDVLLNAVGGAFGCLLVQTLRTDPRIRQMMARARSGLRAHEQES